MTFSTDVGWLNIQELDPRVEALVTVALTAMAQGDPHTHHPDALYSDMKPFLSALLGSGRGHMRVRARHDSPALHEVRFLEVILQPWTGLAVNDDYLHSQWLFDVACNYILERLAKTYDSLYGFAA
jgi:hypothetical protein